MHRGPSTIWPTRRASTSWPRPGRTTTRRTGRGWLTCWPGSARAPPSTSSPDTSRPGPAGTLAAALWAAAANRPGQLAITPDVGQPALPIMSAPEEMAADLWATGVSRICPTPAPARPARPARHHPRRLTVHTRRPHPGHRRGDRHPPPTTRQRWRRQIPQPRRRNRPHQHHLPRPRLDRHRRAAPDSPALIIRGTLERTLNLTNILAEHIQRLPLTMRAASRDFRRRCGATLRMEYLPQRHADSVAH
jgi:hypothetical protein